MALDSAVNAFGVLRYATALKRVTGYHATAKAMASTMEVLTMTNDHDEHADTATTTVSDDTCMTMGDQQVIEEAIDRAIEEIVLEVQTWIRHEITRWHTLETKSQMDKREALRASIAEKLRQIILPF